MQLNKISTIGVQIHRGKSILKATFLKRKFKTVENWELECKYGIFPAVVPFPIPPSSHYTKSQRKDER